MLRSKFVVHEHFAKKAGRHFDLRIEKDGVLKSWAVPKGTLPEKGKRILVIQTSDHDLDYYGFHGELKGGYGAGKVTIFDKGMCSIFKWTGDKIGVDFEGKKLKGMHWLIKLAGSDSSWLWLKG